MLVLGIESSCDETGVALYDTTKGLVADCLHSQISLHAQYGGVVPELASRDHIRYLPPLLEQLWQKANIAPKELDGIAYTAGPGLAGALLVGASVARAMAFRLNIPVLGVHHLEGHLLSPFLSAERPEFPFLALLVSGGHTQFVQVTALGNYDILGDTQDDAVGEAFDKTAHLMNIPYPGGAKLAQLAQTGDKNRFILPRPMFHSGDLNMSFSGLKTAVSLLIKKHSQENFADIASSFEAAIIDVLTHKCRLALKQTGLKQLVIAGGVGANTHLRKNLQDLCQQNQVKLYSPDLAYCSDNGAMIALAGAWHLENRPQQQQTNGEFNVFPRWPLNEYQPIY
jgi:N6-L-threonylcarbamoyladenine synthase